jgi:1-aminocyclopropane-1-carboxylate deaminase/D-cysteine desulfhydrase-like pyridoxal-dependent ACC family enzyme
MITEKTHKYLKDRFVSLSQKAVALKATVDEAKTQFKKEYYSKKLAKVNREAMDVLILIQSSQQVVQQSVTPGKTEPFDSIPLFPENENVIQD